MHRKKFPNYMKSVCGRDICSPIFIVTQFTIVRKRKQSPPSVDDG
jgi:hypothetical protein